MLRHLLLTSAAVLAAPSGMVAQTPTVMPLGDSITEARGGRASYRYFLWHDLAASGHCVDFVGSMRGVYSGQPKYSNFDWDHEGHWGWRIDQILTRLPGWAAAARPDIVLCHLGTNDIWQSQSVASTVIELGQVIDELRKANASVTILLAALIPLGPSKNVDIRPFNNALPALVASKHTVSSPVILVDHFTGWNPALHTYDDVHPNELGEQRMANTWHTAFKTLGRTCQATYRSFGQGCPGSGGIPTLTGLPPIVGRTFSLTLRALPRTSSPAFLITGLSNTRWHTGTLPLDLTGVGMPGCRLYVRPDFTQAIANRTGTATWSAPLPNQPALAGLRFYQQAYAVDPGRNPLGLVVSNAGDGRVGMR